MISKNKENRKKHANIDETLFDLEDRQKIFEDEIIKRIKEIQKYTKNLHFKIKKAQTQSIKKQEEQIEILDRINEVREQLGNNQITEQQIVEIMDNKFQIFDNEKQLYFDNFEDKILRIIDQKFKQNNENQQMQVNKKLQQQQDEVTNQITDHLIP